MQEAWESLLRNLSVVGALALVSTVLLIPILNWAAPRLGLVDRPGGRKQHLAPTPVVGGVAIVLGALAASAFLPDLGPAVTALLAASVLMLAIGTLDDRFDLDWRLRLLGQAAAGLIIYHWGGVRIESIGAALGFPAHTLGALSLPFTVIAVVGLANAMNMADGVDGLAGALCLAALAMLGAGAIYAGNAVLVSRLVLLAGAVAGFLLFNLRTPWNPTARVFLGGGAEILGLWVAWGAFRLTQTPGHPVTPVLAPFLIAPPVIDCLVLIVRRLRAGRSPFYADRNHLHHRMLDAGFSVTGVVVFLTILSLAIGLLAAIARRAHIPEPLFPLVYLAGGAAYYLMTSNVGRRRARAALGGQSMPAPVAIIAQPRSQPELVDR